MKNKLFIVITISLFICNFTFAAENNFKFENVYNKAFYKIPWVQYSILAGVTVAGVAFTTVSGGGGAPVAATGVSTVASWIAGGGAGSYMAGLSMVGSTFGGNAILGSAMLNCASALTVGSVVGKSGLAIVTKLAIGVLQAGQIAIVLYDDERTIAGYSIVIPLSERIGGNKSKELINNIKNLNMLLQGESPDHEFNIRLQLNLKQDAIELFSSSNIEDKVVSVVALHTLGYIDDFKKYAYLLPTINSKRYNFILYLKSIAYLLDQKYIDAYFTTIKIIDNEPKVIEPVLINAIASFNIKDDTFKNNSKYYLERIDKFDSNYYSTVNNKLNAYMLLANLNYAYRDYNKAKELYLKAYKETNMIGDKDKKASLCAAIGNAYYHLRDSSQANKYYRKALSFAGKDSDINTTFASFKELP